MTNGIFEFDFSRWETVLIHLFPAAISAVIFFYTFLFFEKSRINAYFSYFILFLGMWQATLGLMKLSFTAAAANLWAEIGIVFCIIMISLGNLFFFTFHWSSKRKGSRLISVILFAPVIPIFIILKAGLLIYKVPESDGFYCTWESDFNIVTGCILILILAGALTMLIISAIHYYSPFGQCRTRLHRLLLWLGFAIIAAVVFEVILPLFFSHNGFPVVDPIISAFSVSLLIAIRKHKTLKYFSKYHWGGLVEQLNDGILIKDIEDKIRFANKTFLNITGYNFSEIRGKIVSEMFCKKEDKYVIENVLKQNYKKETCKYELEILAKSGEKKWLAITSAPYIDSAGKVIGSVSIHTDITERKKNELASKHTEFRLNQAQSVAKIGSWEINFSSGIAKWSDESCRIYDVPVTEKNKQSFETWISYIHPEDLGKVRSIIEHSKKSLSNTSFNHRIRLHDGTVKHIHSVANFEFNDAGVPVGLFGVCHDITERVEAEETLRESEENMKTFFQESLLAIYFVDPLSKRIIYANPALSSLLGYSSEELHRLTPHRFINHSTEDIDNRMKEVIRKRKIDVAERQWIKKDGRIIYVLVSTFYHSRNGAEAIFVAAQDITERKMYEQQLRDSHEELKMFTYKASHDLKGPLATTLGLISVGKMELNDQKALNYLDMIETTTQKLDYTLTELVKAMQIKDEAKFTEEINFEQLINDVIKKFLYFPKFEQLKISVDISYKEKYISSWNILETISQNLVENAIKYQKSGGGISNLNITIKRSEDNLIMIFEDNGIGMEKEIHDRIFDMYYRGTTLSGGSGIGLYLVKKGVEKLNGRIKLESRLKIGTTISIFLPIITQNNH